MWRDVWVSVVNEGGEEPMHMAGSVVTITISSPFRGLGLDS